MPGCTVELAVVIKRSNIEFSSFFFKSTLFHNYYFRFLCYTYQQEAMGEHHPPVKNWNKLYYHLLLEVNELNRSSDNPRTYILPFEFRNCLVFLPPNHQSLFKNLQKNFLIILLFGGKLLAQKKKGNKKMYSHGQSPLKIKLLPHHSPIIYLPVKYVDSLSLLSLLVIFVFITELLSCFSLPFSKACFFCSEKLGHMPLRRK